MIPSPDRLVPKQLIEAGLPVNWHIPLGDAPETLTPWQDSLIEQVAQFASFLLTHPQSKGRAELVALGFWFRRASLKQLAEQAMSYAEPEKREGKVFHIAPANVDTVFMYSVLLSVLAGNNNIVRVSARSGELCWLLLDLIKVFNAKKPDYSFAAQIAVIEYDAKYTQVTEALSRWSDLRIVWGGDSAIDAVSGIAPETPQVSFPDRFSFAVLELRDKDDLSLLASRLMADVLPFNQQACSSPKSIFWLNTPIETQTRFWQHCEHQIENISHSFTTADTMEQLALLQNLIMQGFIQPVDSDDESEGTMNLRGGSACGPLCRVSVEAITGAALDNHSGHGLLLETQITSLAELPSHQKLQTVVLNSTLPENEKNCINCKRIAPVGNALTFDATWDGVNLLQVFTSLATPKYDHGAD